MMTDTHIFEPDGRAIPYAVEGQGPAVLLIAERGMDVAYLGALAGLLVEEDFRILRLGSRASSTTLDAGVSIHDLAQDAVDVLDHLGVSDAWVGGHAFGGSVARAVAFDHHNRVNGLLLLGVEVSDDLVPLAEGLPILVIQGAEDDITPPSNGEALKASAPDRVSVVNIEGGGHLFVSENVAATSWAIEDYLDWD